MSKARPPVHSEPATRATASAPREPVSAAAASAPAGQAVARHLFTSGVQQAEDRIEIWRSSGRGFDLDGHVGESVAVATIVAQAPLFERVQYSLVENARDDEIVKRPDLAGAIGDASEEGAPRRAVPWIHFR